MSGPQTSFSTPGVSPPKAAEKPARVSAGLGAHAVFAAVTLLYWSTLYICVPVLSPFLADRGLSMNLIGLVLGGYGLTQLIVRLPLGLMSDRLNRRKPFLLLGMLTGALGCWLMMLGDSWHGPLAGRIMSGVSASTWVAFTVLYASYFPPRDATRAMGYISFLTAAGQLLGMAASGWLAELGGYDATFRAGIVLGVLGLAVTLLVREIRSERERPSPAERPARRDARPDGRERPAWKTVLASGQLQEVSLLSLLAHGILFITMFGFTPLMAERLGATGAQLAWLSCAFMVPHAIVSLAAGRWLEPKWGARPLIVLGFAASAVFTALIPFCSGLPWLCATQALNGAAQALYLPLFLGLAIRDVPAAQRATAMGWYQAVYSLGMFSGPYIAGWLNEAGGLTAGFLYGAGLGAAGALLAAGRGAWLARRKRS